jgi:hypothetical protein
LEKAVMIVERLGTFREMTHAATVAIAATPRRNRAYLAEAEENEDEPALLMAQVCTTPDPVMVVQPSTAPAPAMPVEKSEAPAAAMVLQHNVDPAPAIVVEDSTIKAPEHVLLHIDRRQKLNLGQAVTTSESRAGTSTPALQIT